MTLKGAIMYNLGQLRRLRWIVGSLVAAGIAASVAMNVFHAPPGNWAVFAAAVPPLLAFGGIHVIAHIPTFGYKVIAAFRNAGAILVTAGAAAISFWQQKGAIRSLSFQEWESWIWPATVDGFMIVVTLSLVAVSRRYRELSGQEEEESAETVVNRIAEELPVPVSPAPPKPPKRGGRSGPQVGEATVSPLTGGVFTDRPPQV